MHSQDCYYTCTHGFCAICIFMKLNPQFINLMFLFHFLSPWIILFLLAQLTYCKTPSAFKTHMQIRYIFLHFFLPILKQVIFLKLSYTFFSAILPSSPRILPRPVTPHSQFPQIFSLPSWLRSCVVSILISLKQVTFCLLKWISASYLDSSLEIYSSSAAHLL